MTVETSAAAFATRTEPVLRGASIPTHRPWTRRDVRAFYRAMLQAFGASPRLRALMKTVAFEMTRHAH